MTMLSSVSPSVHADPRIDAIADRLAWLHDSPDNDPESYPGPGWDAPGYVPSDDGRQPS